MMDIDRVDTSPLKNTSNLRFPADLSFNHFSLPAPKQSIAPFSFLNSDRPLSSSSNAITDSDGESDLTKPNSTASQRVFPKNSTSPQGEASQRGTPIPKLEAPTSKEYDSFV